MPTQTKAATTGKTAKAPRKAPTRESKNAPQIRDGATARKMQRDDLDIEYFHGLLLEERARLEEERELLRAGSKDLEGSMPEDSEGGEEDTADLATAIMDKEMDLSVEEELEDQLAAIDHALVKIEEGTYGICDISGEPIPESRLKLLPWASLTVQCQAMSEGD
jgi:RNA polymerase-binding transcription factor DksA